MKRYLTLLSALPSLWFWLVPTGLCAGEPQIKVEQVLQTTQSWDSTPYTSGAVRASRRKDQAWRLRQHGQLRRKRNTVFARQIDVDKDRVGPQLGAKTQTR